VADNREHAEAGPRPGDTPFRRVKGLLVGVPLVGLASALGLDLVRESGAGANATSWTVGLAVAFGLSMGMLVAAHGYRRRRDRAPAHATRQVLAGSAARSSLALGLVVASRGAPALFKGGLVLTAAGFFTAIVIGILVS